MAYASLITDEDLISGTPLGGNIDIDKYRSVIKEVQVFVVENLLGTKLYNKILDDFQADTLTGLYATLHTDYLVPIIVHSVAADYIEMAGVSVNNAGIFRRTPEGTEPASPDEITRLAEKSRTKASTYIERMINYLCDNQGLIPEYSVAQDNIYDIKPDKDVSAMGGWSLPNQWAKYKGPMYEAMKDIYYEYGKR